MNTKTTVLGEIKSMSTLTRPKFGPGQLLRDDDLKQGVDYSRELSRLMFRTLLGCGVMCGLDVSSKPECKKLSIGIAAGVALNCHGDPVYVPKPQTITIDFNCAKQPLPTQLWVMIRSFEKHCAPRAAVCSSDDDETPTVCTRERDWFEIRIVDQRPECACGCPEAAEVGLLKSECQCVNPKLECYVDHYKGKCGCNCANCSDCDCEWIILARLDNDETIEGPDWQVDHTVRRFIRPVLIRDPLDPQIPKGNYDATRQNDQTINRASLETIAAETIATKLASTPNKLTPHKKRGSHTKE